MGKPKLREINPYPNDFLFFMDSVCLWLLRLFRLPLDEFLSAFFPTTIERKHLKSWILRKTLYSPFLIVAMLLTLPIASGSALVWLTFQHKKKPYRISISNPQHDESSEEEGKDTFSFATTNLCLLQQCLTRFNNQTDPAGRSRRQGRRIADQQLQARSILKNNNNLMEVLRRKKHKPRNGTRSDECIDHVVLEDFPPLDILLIQEAWMKEYAEGLAEELHDVFPYIVYDAGYNSWATNCFLSNSGQMIASRYPIIDIRFDAYKSKFSQCRLASKGLLQIKVLVKETESFRYVGYAYTTHLQAYQGTRPIHSQQLSDICDWTTRFRQSTLQPNEIVVFDVVGGDFNLDNASPVDKPEWNHAIFRVYNDIGRAGPGMDQPWIVGTELRHTPLHDPVVQTPAGLKLALEDPLRLQYYVIDGTVSDFKYEVAWEMPPVDSHGKQIWHRQAGRRRLDYIMQRASDSHIKSVELTAVTQMAGLTDHVAYCLTVHVPELQSLTPDAMTEL